MTEEGAVPVFCATGTMGKSSYKCPTHVHNNCSEMVYYTEGRGKLISGANSYSFKEGDIIYVPAGIPHGEVSKSGYRNIYCDILDDGELGTEILVFRDNYNHEFRQILDQIASHFLIRDAGWREIAEALTGVLMAYMTAWRPLSPKNQYVDMCERIIAANISNIDFSFEEIYKSIPLSEMYFIRLFKRDTGYTPNGYLFEKRMQHAMEVLSNWSFRMKIKDVASFCGYKGAYHFSAVFKQKTGLSPKRWREEHIQKV